GCRNVAPCKEAPVGVVEGLVDRSGAAQSNAGEPAAVDGCANFQSSIGGEVGREPQRVENGCGVVGVGHNKPVLKTGEQYAVARFATTTVASKGLIFPPMAVASRFGNSTTVVKRSGLSRDEIDHGTPRRPSLRAGRSEISRIFHCQ